MLNTEKAVWEDNGQPTLLHQRLLSELWNYSVLHGDWRVARRRGFVKADAAQYFILL